MKIRRLLWESYNDRLGTYEFTHIYFDLANLLHNHDGLDHLAAPFVKEEIDDIVKEHPYGKSPGLDGFNTDFMKNAGPSYHKTFMSYVITSTLMIYACRELMDLTLF
jgi:hypothetical protein